MLLKQTFLSASLGKILQIYISNRYIRRACVVANIILDPAVVLVAGSGIALLLCGRAVALVVCTLILYSASICSSCEKVSPSLTACVRACVLSSVFGFVSVSVTTTTVCAMVLK